MELVYKIVVVVLSTSGFARKLIRTSEYDAMMLLFRVKSQNKGRILFKALSRFRVLFDGDGPSVQNRDTTVNIILERKIC